MLRVPNELLVEAGGGTGAGTGTGSIGTGEVDLSGGEIRAAAEEGTTSTSSGLVTGGNGSEVVVGIGENAKKEARTHAQGVPGSGYDNGCGGGGGGENNSQQSQVRIGGDLLFCVREMRFRVTV